MSKVTIQGDASGTGIFTIASPNSNTDRTLVLPDEAGTVLTKAAGSPDNSVVVDASGNVGIFTSSPTNKLHVVGTAKIEGSTLDLNDAGTFTISQNTTASALILRTATSSYLRFDTNGANERMRIASNGDLLVATTSAFNSGKQCIAFNSAAHVGIALNQTNANNSGTFLNFTQNGVTIGYIAGNATTTTYATSSDYRLKEDWVAVADASTRVNALKPVNFAWKADGSRVDGFLAHELAEVVPEAVTGTKDAMRDEEYEVTSAVLDDEGAVVTPAVMGTRSVPDYQGIDQSKLVPLLTAALQEALARIETLEADVATLKGIA